MQDGSRSQPTITQWLSILSAVFPPKGVLLVGAGNGSSHWVEWLCQKMPEAVCLVEGDGEQFRHLARRIPSQYGWVLRNDVVAPQAGRATFFQASNPAESGLLEPEELSALWPHLVKIGQKQTDSALTIQDIVKETGLETNWLIVDCLPAGEIIRGADPILTAADVIILRGLFNHAEGVTKKAAQQHLSQVCEAAGLRYVEGLQSRHPILGHFLFVRDTIKLKKQSKQFEELANMLQEQLETAKAELDGIRAKHQSQIAQITALQRMQADKQLIELQKAEQSHLNKNLLLSNKKQKKLFIDCGGHDGCSAIKYLLANSDFDAISFEPNPIFWDYYLDIPTLLQKKAVATHNNPILFTIDPVDGDGSSYVDKKRIDITGQKENSECPQILVDCIDVSEFIRDAAELYEEVVLKLDVEGAEYEILQKMILDGTLGKVSKLLCEFHWQKIGMSEAEHTALLEVIQRQVPVEEWDALEFSVHGRKSQTLMRIRSELKKSLRSEAKGGIHHDD